MHTRKKLRLLVITVRLTRPLLSFHHRSRHHGRQQFGLGGIKEHSRAPATNRRDPFTVHDIWPDFKWSQMSQSGIEIDSDINAQPLRLHTKPEVLTGLP